MTTEQIHKIVYLNGLVRGNVIHRFKINGRTVGLDELRYNDGRKHKGNVLRVNYYTAIYGNND